jgi:mannose-6-phosphate isomerase-like protein (cupin superfamily)
MKSIALVALALVYTASAVSAQGRGTSGRGRGAAPPAAQVRVSVHDETGAPLGDVKLTLSGTATDNTTTNGFGAAVFTNLKDGVYRIRFEHDGYLTLEREFAVTAKQPPAVDVQLSPAPPPPPPPPPPAPAIKSLPPGGPPVNLSIPGFLDKNMIGGRDPLKESVISCTPLETVRLLQLREALAEHAHADADEVLYVIAGEGAIRFGGDATPISAGSVSVVPHGTRHLVERRGRNPLILLSTLSGTPCKSTQ